MSDDWHVIGFAVVAVFVSPILFFVGECLIRAEKAIWRRWRYGVPFKETWDMW